VNKEVLALAWQQHLGRREGELAFERGRDAHCLASD